MDRLEKLLTKDSLTKVTPTVNDTPTVQAICNTAKLAETSDDDNSMLPDDKIHPSAKMVLLLTKKTMNRYYEHTDESNVYRISMSICTMIFMQH
jgi:hypothetical protein